MEGVKRQLPFFIKFLVGKFFIFMYTICDKQEGRDVHLG